MEKPFQEENWTWKQPHLWSSTRGGSSQKVCLLSHASSFSEKCVLRIMTSVKYTGAGCHFILQGISPTQGLKPLLLCLHWQVYSLPLHHLGCPVSSQEIVKITLDSIAYSDHWLQRRVSRAKVLFCISVKKKPYAARGVAARLVTHRTHKKRHVVAEYRQKVSCLFLEEVRNNYGSKIR